MADDTKKLLTPEDKNRGGDAVNGSDRLGNDFRNFDTLYGPTNEVFDDLPDGPVNRDGQRISPNRATLESVRQKAFDQSQVNQYRMGRGETLDNSPDQFLSRQRQASTIDRPSNTVTLGAFFKKSSATFGQRLPEGEVLSDRGEPQEAGGKRLLEVNPQGRDPIRPFGRSPRGTDGPAYGSPQGAEPGTGPVVERAVSDILTTNRFSSFDQNLIYAPDERSPDENIAFSLQREVGAYNPARGQTQPDGSSGRPDIELQELKQLGAKLLQQATGFGYNEALQDAKAQVPASTLRPRGLPRDRDPRGINEDTFENRASDGEFSEPDDGNPIESFGALNTPDSPFNGVNPAEMKALADAIIAVTVEAVSGPDLAPLIPNIAPVIGPGNAPFTKGSFIPKDRNGGAQGRPVFSNLMTDIGFVYTATPYRDAVTAGMKILIGEALPGREPSIKSRSGIPKADFEVKANSAKNNIASSPGFYVNFCRAILRDADSLVSRFTDINGLSASSMFEQPGVFTYIEEFKRSRLVAAVNVFATIGDAAARNATSPYKVDQLPDSGDVVKSVAGFPIDYRPEMHAMKSRDGNFTKSGPDSLRLAWRGSSTPSMFLLPAEIEFGSVLNTVSTLSNDSPLAAHASMESKTRSVSYGRLPQEFVENHERLLDAEYVPFYFHDLRTNEVVSFHAFLSDLSDDYSVDYNSQRTFGRADPVHVYRSTTRSVGFTFFVAATSREDFNEMWFKINKLITLLYPQYTQGRVVSDQGGGEFVMPFSQIAAASPMIRLRIGDVVKTNYSKFNLSRLFGLGTESFSPGPAQIGSLSTAAGAGFTEASMATRKKVVEASLDAYRVLLGGLAAFAGPGEGPFGITPKFPGSEVATSAALSVGGAINAIDALRLATRRARKMPTDRSGFIARKTDTGLGVGDVVLLSYPSVRYLDPVATEKGISDRLYLPYKDVFATVNGDPSIDEKDQSTAYYPVKIASTFSNARLGLYDIAEDSTFKMSHHDATIIPHGLKTVTQIINGLRVVAGGANLITGYALDVFGFLSNPLDPNPVVKAFDQSGGKGLAGVIKSMRFKWIDDASPWETEKGARAPKICQITVGFDPVHDIAPGLDHKGYNRAPVYPVGQVVNAISGKSGDFLDSDVANTLLNAFDTGEAKNSQQLAIHINNMDDDES